MVSSNRVRGIVVIPQTRLNKPFKQKGMLQRFISDFVRHRGENET